MVLDALEWVITRNAGKERDKDTFGKQELRQKGQNLTDTGRSRQIHRKASWQEIGHESHRKHRNRQGQ
jgi:hypothetical protein